MLIRENSIIKDVNNKEHKTVGTMRIFPIWYLNGELSGTIKGKKFKVNMEDCLDEPLKGVLV